MNKIFTRLQLIRAVSLCDRNLQFFTLEEASEKWGISVDEIKLLIREKKIASVSIGRSTRILYPQIALGYKEKYEREPEPEHIQLAEENYEKSEPQKVEGYVYFIQSLQYIKIGKSRSLRNRIEQYKLHNPFAIFLGHIQTFDYADFEGRMHAHLIEKCFRGEWFEISPDDAFEAARNVIQLYEMKNCLITDLRGG